MKPKLTEAELKARKVERNKRWHEENKLAINERERKASKSMREVEQLKKRIDDSGTQGVETAHIRDDYEPVGSMMIHDICASGEYVQRKVPPGGYDQKWKVFKKGTAPPAPTFERMTCYTQRFLNSMVTRQEWPLLTVGKAENSVQ